MDVVDVTEEMTLNDVEVRHIIPVSFSKATIWYVYVFIDKQANTYYWTTPNHQPFVEGQVYDIECKCDRSRNNRLSYVKIIRSGSTAAVQSEQPAAKPDAEDVLLGLKDY